METEQFHIQKGIWTFPDVGSSLRTVYIPYLESMTKGKNGLWEITYSRGRLTFVDLKKTCTVLLYGYTGSIDASFIKACIHNNVNILLTSRNEKYPALIFAERPHQKIEALVAQILVRENEKRRVYVARMLLLKRLKNTGMKLSHTVINKINAARTVEKLRLIEASETKRYWALYYASFGVEDIHRREDHPINKALDMGSFFLAGIISRWILANRLSPHFGFLHTSSHYPALVYDLMEPYRYIIENATKEQYLLGGEDSLVERVNSELRRSLQDQIYVVELKTQAARRGLLQGSVVALRAYLEGSMKRFVLPSEGKPNGGRPLKITYSILGSGPNL